MPAVVPFDGSRRPRLMLAMASVVAHHGYRGASVDRVLEQAHVAWQGFIDEFEDLDACFLATFDAAFECAAAATERGMLSAPAGDGEAIFGEGLAALLEAIAGAPGLAVLCLEESSALGARAVEHKEAGLQRFVALLRHRLAPTDGEPSISPLAAEMVVGGVYEVIQRKARAGELAELPSLSDELRQLWLPIIRSGAA